MSRKKLLIFVAKGSGESRVWSRTVDRLKHLDHFSVYEFHIFRTDQSPESWFRESEPQFTSASLDTRASRLTRFLSSSFCSANNLIDDPEITLIATKYGCTIVQKTLTDQVSGDNNNANLIHKIRSILFINPAGANLLLFLGLGLVMFILAQSGLDFLWDPATVPPFFKHVKILLSALVGTLAVVLPVLLSSEALNVLGLDRLRLATNRLANQFSERIAHGSKKQEGSWPIPVQSLRIRRFNVKEETQLDRLSQAVTDPVSHPGLYDVKLLERHLKVSPCSPQSVPSAVQGLVPAGSRAEIFGHDQASYRILVQFSAGNCPFQKSSLDPWRLRYSTLKGILDVHSAHSDNEWNPEYIAQYHREHRSYEYHFFPERSRSYSLDLTVYNGFSESEQTTHIHLRSDTYYRKIRHVLDLRDFLSDDWVIRQEPSVLFIQNMLPFLNSGDNGASRRRIDGLECDCAERDQSTQIRQQVAVEKQGGVYWWELEGIRDGGIISFRYSIDRAI